MTSQPVPHDQPTCATRPAHLCHMTSSPVSECFWQQPVSCAGQFQPSRPVLESRSTSPYTGSRNERCALEQHLPTHTPVCMHSKWDIGCFSKGFYLLPKWIDKWKNHFYEMRGEVGMSCHEKIKPTRRCLHQDRK